MNVVCASFQLPPGITNLVGAPDASYTYIVVNNRSPCCTTLIPHPFSPIPAHHMSCSGESGARSLKRFVRPLNATSIS